MKSILFMLALGFVNFAFAQQSVTKNLGSFGDWQVDQVASHDLWKTNACVAFVAAGSNASTLEIYAGQLTGSATEYARATVEVVARGLSSFVRATLSDEQTAEKYQLTLASNAANPSVFGLLARLGDRTKLIDMLKRANTATLQLIDQNGSVVKTLSFSLHGSTKAIEAAMAGCTLSL